MPDSKKQQKNRRDSIKDWRFHALPPEHSRTQFTTSVNLVLRCKKQCILPGQLTLHVDRGTSMSSKPVAFLLADLGVTKTHSRPHVSDDNPYSESQFRTMKYRPEFPDRFGCIQNSRAFSQGFFRWYNEEHRHSGLFRRRSGSTNQQVQMKKLTEFREHVSQGR
jgi:transposase InsO family protein